MTGRRKGGRALAVLLLAFGFDVAVAQLVDCSDFPVQEVLVNAPPADALNILILGDGFQADELDTYRRAACLLVEGILSEQPFANFACRSNFYRIDSVTSYDDIEVGCNAPAYARTWTAAAASACTSASEAGPPASGVATLDLNTKVCPSITPGVSRIVWPDYTASESATSDTPLGEKRALELAAVCAASKNIHTIILLSDTATPAAAAARGVSVPRLTVTTLAAIEFDDSRHYRIAHELGHTLTLLDEYKDKDWESDDYHCGRNVWSPCDDCDNPPDGVPDSPFHASWAAYCEPWQPMSQTKEVQRCGPSLQASPCLLGLCGNPSSCPDPCGTRPADLPAVGLYEGGFYEECGYYRSQQYCRMEDNIDKPFCIGCLCVAKRFLEQDVGLTECSTPSVCPTPDILIRDCATDDGTVPSACVGIFPDSPDISFSLMLDSANPSGTLMNTFVCAVNNGDTIEDGRLFARLRLEAFNASGAQVQRALLSAAIDSLVPFPSETIPERTSWPPGERRCLQRLARFPGLLPPVGARVDAVLWIRGDPPVPYPATSDDNNQAAKHRPWSSF